MDNAYTDAVVGSSLKGREKLCLIGLIYRMNNADKTSLVSQENLADLTGLGVNTVIAGLAELQHQNIISHVGWRKANPSADRPTKVYRIWLDVLQRLVRPNHKSMVPDAGTIPSPGTDTTHREPVQYPRQVTYSTAPEGAVSNEIVPSARGGVDVRPRVEKDHRTVQYRPDSSNRKDSDQEQPQEQQPNPRGVAPIPTGDFSSPRPHGSSADHSGGSAAAPVAAPAELAKAPTLTEDEVGELIQLWDLGLNCPVPQDDEGNNEREAVLRRFNKCPAATLAVDMMWAFTLSNYWKKTDDRKVWPLGCTMENFLDAHHAITGQFSSGRWEQNGIRAKLLKKFPTVMSVARHVNPSMFAVDQEAADKTETKECWFCKDAGKPCQFHGGEEEPLEELTVRKAFEIEE